MFVIVIYTQNCIYRRSDFEDEANKEGLCMACDEAIKKGEKQTKDIESGKIKIEEPEKSPKKKK